jgi:hypothetical protein
MTPVRSNRRLWPALAVVVLMFVGLAGLLSLVPGNPDVRRDPAGSILLLLAFAAFGLLGALVVWRRPGNTLGWIMAAVGLLATWGPLADTYADIAYDAGRGSGALFSVSAWISLWYWYPLLGLILLFTPLLFPDGRPLSPRWRPVVWLAGLDIALITFLAAFHERFEVSGISMANPVGIAGIQNPEDSRPGSILFSLLFVLLGTALLSVVIRYRRSGSVQRQQMKWLMFATALAILQTVLEGVIGYGSDSVVLFAIVVALFPVAVAVAIFKYRLYEIDIIINRTLVYGSLTVTLLACYVSAVVVLQRVFILFTGEESTLAVVASTLAIAALFNPLRRRFQASIDLLFYRKKYDAAKTLEAFSLGLREESDLDELNDSLVSVVRETMQPAHVSLWLRTPGETR